MYNWFTRPILKIRLTRSSSTVRQATENLRQRL